MSVLQKVPLEAIKATQSVITEASGLPNAVYADPELFDFERDNVIGKTWAGLEYANELPKNGYAKPVDFMGLPLLLIRDRAGEIRVFHNVCSHRGMLLVHEERPILNLLQCRYHSWTYDLSGELKGTPHIGGVGQNTAEGFSRAGKGLKEIRSTQWMGIVFVNLSGDAMAFEDFIEPLVSRWEAFTGTGALNNLHDAGANGKMEFTIGANWKLAMENYCEAYHLPWVHPDLNSYSPLDEHINLEVNEYMSGQGTLNYALTEIAGRSLPKFSDWPEDKFSEGEYIALYPNLMLGLQVDHVFVILLRPKACNKTLEKIQVSYVNEDSITEELAQCRHAVMSAWKLVFEEDIFAVEGMQKGRNSPGFRGGVFSPTLDVPSHVFHKWVARRYEEALT